MKVLNCKVPPMLISLLMGILMWITAVIFPSFTVLLPFRLPISLCLTIIGFAIVFSSGHSFTKAKASFNPVQFDKVTALVTSGVYSFTRNPMYLGVINAFIGWAYYLGNPFSAVLVPLNIIYLNCFQIRLEETVLEEKFGREFMLYKAKVRRWI